MVSVVNLDLTRCSGAAGENPATPNARSRARVVEHINQGEQTQFAAATFNCPTATSAEKPTYKGTLVISFRGTDDSLIGWKEDFNMAFQYPVPAQRSASAYWIWWRDCGRVRLFWSAIPREAIWRHAAMNADPKVRKRIQHVYSLDGPGFPPEIVTSPPTAPSSRR